MLQLFIRMKTANHSKPITLTRRCRLLLGLGIFLCFALLGCRSAPPPTNARLPHPTLHDAGPAKRAGVYATIRRADIPLDQPTDDAWTMINEQVVPPVTRGVWRGNGLRIGLLPRDQLDTYSKVMPQPVAFSRMQINRSTQPTPIIETPTLRSSLRFKTDLTQLPRPRKIEFIKGGNNSTLRLLARIETLPDGQHTLILTPQHHIPSRLNLIPRDPFDKAMDGRVYDELSLRVTLSKDQIAVVGLHWPWPIEEALDEGLPEPPPSASQAASSTSTRLPSADFNDPAAPPKHLQTRENTTDSNNAPAPNPPDSPSDNEAQHRPRHSRTAPPLETSFGSTLFTGTRIRQPVRTVLLITIEEPKAEPPNLPKE